MKFLGRLARHRPALSVVIVATLALGIGSATALYSVVEAVLVRPFPFRDQGRLVALWQSDVTRNHPFVEVSYLDARDWGTRAAGAFESIASMSSVNFATTLTGVGDPQQLQLRVVSDPFFELLGAPPALGRTLQKDDHRFGAPPVVVIGHGVWQRIFGGDPGIVGRSIALDGQPRTVVGVMRQGFSYPEEANLWAPVEQIVGPKALENRGLFWMVAVGRLRPGTTVDQARAALDVTIAAITRELFPKSPEPFHAVVRPLVGELLGTTRQALLLLLGAVGAVLLIACANVSNLLLGRSIDRRREIATRTMLGASRGRLARHLIAEVLPLSIAGGVLGIGLAWIAVESLVRIAGAELPRADEIQLNLTAVVVAGILSIGTGLLCALAPLLQTREVALASAFRDDSRAGTGRLQRRLRDLLVTAEIALALVLLVGATLLVASFLALRSQDLGFRAGNLLTVEVSLASPKYQNAEQVRVAQRELAERLRAIPGVQSASAILLRPLWSAVGYDGIYLLEGQRAEDVNRNPVINIECTMPGYFSTMGIRLVAGRDFTEQDGMKSSGVVIVSESLARTAWPGQDPIGKRLSMNMPSSPFDDKWLSVVGVVADVRYREIETARLDLYQPYRPVHVSRQGLRPQDVRRSTRYRSGRAPCDPRGRSDSARRAPHDGSDRGDRDGTVAAEREVVRRAGDPRRGALGRRNLQRDELCREPPHAGDRRAHRARSGTEGDHAHGPRRRSAPRGRRAGGGRSRRLHGHGLPAPPARWRRAASSGCIRGGNVPALRHRDRGLPDSGTARRRSRSDGGYAG